MRKVVIASNFKGVYISPNNTPSGPLVTLSIESAKTLYDIVATRDKVFYRVNSKVVEELPKTVLTAKLEAAYKHLELKIEKYLKSPTNDMYYILKDSL